jgi:hypothetical protein
MSKLPSRSTKGRRTRLDLLVIRLNKGGTVGNSKPCVLCLEELKKLPGRGYILDTVHYSLMNRIVTVKFSELLEAPKHVPKFFSEDPNDRRTQQEPIRNKKMEGSGSRFHG